jgi:lipopolysaccharide transport system ATP-binding protein
MSDTVISVENLSKRYTIQHRSGDDGLRHAIHDFATAPIRWLSAKGKALRGPQNGAGHNGNGASPGPSGFQLHAPCSTPSPTENFWALKDVSFDVKRGEVVGIIGRNGAGKSTLLKVLSRITEPTKGRVRIRGRVASLLEVGTGFHPELTGRENIYLNGAVLGMTRDEIRRKFDEIVAFAEIEKFLDTPVKRYSSGMYVRLAFAVAAHLEPEILLVDEVLAVGDSSFQNKCLGKLSDVSYKGRTVLFVSHDLTKITNLCGRGILLKDGNVEAIGLISTVVAYHLQQGLNQDGYADLTTANRTGSGRARFQWVELSRKSNRCSVFPLGGSLTLRTCVEVRNTIGNGNLAATIRTDGGTSVYCLWSLSEGLIWTTTADQYVFEINLPELQLYPGTYTVDLWLGDDQQNRVDYIQDAIGFQVIQTAESCVPTTLRQRDGLVFSHSEWKYERVE